MKWPELLAEEICNVQPMSGNVGLEFAFKISEKFDWNDDENPYHICDGKWGGWGPQSWYTFEWSKNVFEIETIVIKENLPEGYDCKHEYKWKRCWDDNAQLWRKVSEEELKLLPVLRDRLFPTIKFDKISIPIIKNIND